MDLPHGQHDQSGSSEPRPASAPQPPVRTGESAQQLTGPTHNGSGLTRAMMDAMSEAELRGRVLLPLFRAMGFRDVDHYHGGAMEQGKDFVMWKPDDFGARVNYVVVVKAGRISGSASGSGSAAEASMQIRQACSDPFRDARTGQQERVTACFVVASGDIRKEARQSIMNGLGPGVAPDVRFIDGDTLWEQVQKHLPAPTALELLAQAQARLAEASGGREITLDASGEGVRVYIAPAGAASFPDAEGSTTPAETGGAPGVGRADGIDGVAAAAPGDSVRLIFHDTAAGRAAAAQLSSEFPTGTPVALNLEAVAQVEWPDIVAPLIAAGTKITSLTVEARTVGDTGAAAASGGQALRTVDGAPPPFPASVDIVAPSGETTRLGPMLLSITPANAAKVFASPSTGDVVSFANVDAFLPWRFTLAAHPAPGERRVDLRFTPRIGGANVKLVADALRFQEALGVGGTLHLRDARTGLSLFAGAVPAGALKPRVPAGTLLFFAEALARIQARLNHWFSMPTEGVVSGRDVGEAREAASIVETGMTTRSYNSVTMQMDRGGAERLLSVLLDGVTIDLTEVGEQTRVIAGETIPLGKVALVLPQVWMTEEERSSLRARLAAGDEEEFVPVTVMAAKDGAPARWYYRDWIRPADLPAGLADVLAPPASAAPASDCGELSDGDDHALPIDGGSGAGPAVRAAWGRIASEAGMHPRSDGS